MASEWIECTLADACASIDYGLTASASATSAGPKFLRITDIVSGSVDWKSVPHVDADAATAKKYSLAAGDIVLARTGASTGASAYVKDPPASVFASYLVRLKARPEFDSRFLAYYLKSEPFQQFIRGVIGDKSAQPNASASTMTKAPLRAPRDLPEQRRIAHILGTLDDKIELNRRMNETLEAMARALFKSWFVDFDPVRAKAEGRDPGLPPHLADLFPSRLVDSEFGEIPEGWGIGPIEAICESITSGGTPSRREPAFWEGGTIPWFKTGELHDGPLLKSAEQINEIALAASSCKLWPAGTILFALYASPTVGRIGVLTTPGTSNQAAAGLVAEPAFGTPWLRRLLVEARARLQTIAVGAAQQNINLLVLKTHRTVVPNVPVAAAFSRLVGPMDQVQVVLAEGQQVLADARDTLLRLFLGPPAAQ
jgi:type I restriction enzyme S subunit